MTQIVATVTVMKQLGPELWRDHHISRVFKSGQSMDDILTWAKAMSGEREIRVGDVLLSEYAGGSADGDLVTLLEEVKEEFATWHMSPTIERLHSGLCDALSKIKGKEESAA